MPDAASRHDVLASVSDNLRRLRQARGISQVALAEASGVSRRMIVSLEGGDTNISIASLDRLAKALAVSFVDLVSDPARQRKRIEAVAWRGSSAASFAMLLGSVPARREAELWSWSLDEGEHYDAEAMPPGWSEMLVVTLGSLAITLEDGETLVGAGDYVIYSSERPYTYRNAFTGVTRFICAVVM